MKRLCIAALLLSGCAMTPEMQGISSLCNDVMGDRGRAYQASQELVRRGFSPNDCAAVVAIQRQEALQMMGLGAGMMMQSQPRVPYNCQVFGNTVQCR